LSVAAGLEIASQACLTCAIEKHSERGLIPRSIAIHDFMASMLLDCGYATISAFTPAGHDDG